MPEGKYDQSDRIRKTSYLAYPELLVEKKLKITKNTRKIKLK